LAHSLRHFVNTNYRQIIKDDDVLRDFLGHKDPKMTEHYDHPNLEDKIIELEPYRQKIEQFWDGCSEGISGI
jgi:integrase